MYFKKFYDTATTEQGGTAATETAVAEPQVLSPAQAMAQFGVKTIEGTVATPILNTEIKEEPKPAEVTPVVATNEQTATPQANPETPSPIVEQQATPTPLIEAGSPTVQTWQEVLTSQQPNSTEVLKQLGFDDKTVEILNEVKDYDKKEFFSQFLKSLKDGKGNEYLREWNTDYSKMSAEDVMRHQLRQEYPKASEAALNALYKKEIVEAYNLDSSDANEIEEGNLLLEAKADRYRDKLIANQQNFLTPKPPEVKQPEPDLAQERQRQFEESYATQVKENSTFKNISATKQFSLGEGEEKFTYPVEPEKLFKALSDSETWAATQFDIEKNPNGTVKAMTPKVEHQILTTMVGIYGKPFLDEYAKHFKSIGGDTAIKSIDNAKPPEGGAVVKSDVLPTNPAEAMARHGRLVTGG